MQEDLTIEVLDAGIFTSFQDLGRDGFQSLGVNKSGVLDEVSAKIANFLVKNDENTAVLEMILKGGTFKFNDDCIIALSGADCSPKLNGKNITTHTAISIKKGDVLSMGFAINGTTCYLSIENGFLVPKVLNSAATNVASKIGGFHGRALMKGDVILFKAQKRGFKWSDLFKGEKHTIIPYHLTSRFMTNKIRLIKGLQYDYFTNEKAEILTNDHFTITPQSNRQGYRLEQERTFALKEPLEMISEIASFGTCQVPPNGKMIILMSDAQSTGGYPKLAQVIKVDLPTLAQRKIGSKLQFELVEIDEALQLLKKQARYLEEIQDYLA